MTTAERAITGIGSLPHHNIDAALEYSFRMGIPFLPQIPLRNPWEFMIAQALEGLPGLTVESDGSVALNPDLWLARSHELDRRLGRAFEASPSDGGAFSEFEPSAASSSSWQPFLWELGERGTRKAKLQLAGPMTSQWALRMKDGTRVESRPGLSTQIYRLCLARAMAMIRRLKALGIEPLFYLDEPGLYAYSPDNPRHVLAMQELKLMLQTLRKEGASTGLHCCSNAHWPSVLQLGLDYLSIDTRLSLESLLSPEPGIRAALDAYLDGGGKLSLGVIPTGRSSLIRSLDARALQGELQAALERAWSGQPSRARKALREAIFTPACGLALQTPEDSEFILEILSDFYDFCAITA